MATTVTVLDDYQGCCAFLDAAHELDDSDLRLDVEHRHLAASALPARLADSDAVILIRERTTLTRELLAQLPNLKLVVQTGRLSSAIDLEACDDLGIAVRDGTGSPTAPAELTWLLIMAGCRRLGGYLDRQARGEWQRSSDRLETESLGHAVSGRTLGIWGLGKIGSLVVGYAEAFGMQVIAHGRESSAGRAFQLGVEFEPDRRAFLARCDVVTLHLKLNDETRGMISAADLAAMRAEALLVNTSRAELIRPGALLDALDAGRPGSAALDVYENEPDGARPYQHHSRVLATPHLGFVERDTFERYFSTAFRQVREFFAAKN
ncbi:D-2-hydroxyacid dehydrogenase family protein [Salinicola rhizosphaerae]|uniref:D-isomer specific 2-hydroxyacid dehydrogenase n=1 Tax=Salinicola rhizosphaerae TaxID=1443141 RepID=A0ABQ3DWA4_9GAMM|nr:D-2-hydroxyacid dehydrogenase family protein [Salinicola rhizosphaerae]GHB17362.1 D-isomer specific 2-hydroxyacid dehydrogenase [Salinicola rhizosphaerae]